MKKIRAFMLAACLTAASVGCAYAQDASTPAPDPNAAANPAVKSPDDMASTGLAKGQNSFTKAEAKGRIEKAGYTNVTGLTKDANGLWQGQAMRDGQRVNVALDYKGNVSSK
jgi:opacity protein-like surface antigen